MATRSLIKAHGARFLDPANVGSSVRWSVTADEYVSEKSGNVTLSMEAQMSLSDCSRTINWSAYNDDLLLLKVQEAIAELRNAEKVLKRVAKLREQYGSDE